MFSTVLFPIGSEPQTQTPLRGPGSLTQQHSSRFGVLYGVEEEPKAIA